MSDDQFISKQTAMQLANELQISVDGYHMYNQAINNYCAEIGSLPEAIVRCKDCKHWGRFGYCTYGTRLAWIGGNDDYCSKGERRTDA